MGLEDTQEAYTDNLEDTHSSFDPDETSPDHEKKSATQVKLADTCLIEATFSLPYALQPYLTSSPRIHKSPRAVSYGGYIQPAKQVYACETVIYLDNGPVVSLVVDLEYLVPPLLLSAYLREFRESSPTMPRTQHNVATILEDIAATALGEGGPRIQWSPGSSDSQLLVMHDSADRIFGGRLIQRLSDSCVVEIKLDLEDGYNPKCLLLVDVSLVARLDGLSAGSEDIEVDPVKLLELPDSYNIRNVFLESLGQISQEHPELILKRITIKKSDNLFRFLNMTFLPSGESEEVYYSIDLKFGIQ
jgi:hypothetical protein